MRDRRRARGALAPPAAWASRQLRDWISGPDSRILQLQGSFLRSEQSRDLAIDLVELLQTTGLPVIWYLANTAINDSAVTTIDILCSLIKQTISQNMDAAEAWGSIDSHFAACKTERDWLRLFVIVLAHVRRLVIIIDAQKAVSGMPGMVAEFWREVNKQHNQTTVKILVLTYEAPTITALSGFPVLPLAAGYGRTRVSPGTYRTHSRFSARRCRPPQNPRSTGPDDLKPFVLRLISSDAT